MVRFGLKTAKNTVFRPLKTGRLTDDKIKLRKQGVKDMEIRVIKENNIEIAIVNSDEILITDVQSALDFLLQ